MPQIEIEAGEYLDDYVRPFASACGLLPFYSTFKAAFSGVLDRKYTFDVPDPFPDGGGGGGGAVQLPLPGLVPIEPDEVLKAVADAIAAAEKILNAENLAIGGATAEVNVVVSVGGLAGANANLKINLGPTPRG